MDEKPRILGLDVGSRRIGIAITDGLGLTAQPLFTLTRGNDRADLKSLARLARKHAVAEIVVGNPLHLSGELSAQAAKTQAFAHQLGELTGIPIVLWDERLTTSEAHEILDRSGYGTRGRKKVIDQVAAVVILESYISSRQHGLSPSDSHTISTE